MNKLSELEKKILDSMAGYLSFSKSCFYSQISNSLVASREFNNSGQWTKFDCRGVESCSFEEVNQFPIVTVVSHPSLKHGGAFAVWVENGFISMLEGYTFGDDDWPRFLESGDEVEIV